MASNDPRYEYKKQHRQKNAAKYAAAVQRHRQKHPELNKEYYCENKEYFQNKGKEWRSKNKDLHTAKAARYRAALLQAMPKWLTEEDHNKINWFYTEAQRLTKETGIIYHVDHIIPLKGKNVCGLHVPSNLRVIPASENIRKKNKYIEELVWPR